MAVKELSVRQTAGHMKCSSKYVRDLLYDDKLPGARRVNGQWRIPLSAIEARLKMREARQ